MKETLEDNKTYLEAFRTNDQHTMSRCYSRFKPDFQKNLASSYNYLPSHYLDDVYQDAFIQLGENIISGKISEDTLNVPIGAYLYGIGQHIAKEYVRNYGGTNQKADYEEVELPFIPGEEDSPFSLDDRKLIRKYVNEMQEPCADILTKFYFDDYTIFSIALLRGYKNEDSAKTQKHKCFTKLRNAIKHHLHGYFDFEN